MKKLIYILLLLLSIPCFSQGNEIGFTANADIRYNANIYLVDIGVEAFEYL